MPVRFGYDVVEAIAIEEGTFGTTPTTGAWRHFGYNTGFDPRPRIIFKEQIGLGRQIINDTVKTKEYAELLLAYELLAKEADPAYQWTNFISYALGATGEGATIALEKHLKSLSIGAKLDLAADEYWLIKGAKLNRTEIHGNILNNEPLVSTLNILAQRGIYGTTDYVSGSATRQAAPTADYILPSDCDIEIPTGSSIIGKVSEFTLSINRNLMLRGTDSTTKTLYRSIEEGKCEVELTVIMDFEDKTELDDFLASTARNATLKIPSASGGRTVTLTGGRWREMTLPKRELELIAYTLTAPYSNISIGTIA